MHSILGNIERFAAALLKISFAPKTAFQRTCKNIHDCTYRTLDDNNILVPFGHSKCKRILLYRLFDNTCKSLLKLESQSSLFSQLSQKPFLCKIEKWWDFDQVLEGKQHSRQNSIRPTNPVLNVLLTCCRWHYRLWSLASTKK